MRISIISPSFNQVAFIERTIESVASQSHTDKEHIIVDGGSTDGCSEIATFAEQTFSHIRTLVEPDSGQADAINKGFRLATGDILTWLNTDDYYSDPDVLAAVAEYFTSHPKVDIVWGRGLRVDSDGREISPAWVQPPDTDFTVALQRSLGLLQPSVFFRRSVVETVGGLSEDWPLQLDYEYWIRIAQAGFRFGFIDRDLSHAVVHADAKSTAQRMQQLNECLRLAREKFQYVPVEWIRQYGEFFLTRKDHKVTKDLRLDDVQQTEYAAIERALLQALNGDQHTQQLLKERADIEPYASTYRAMRVHGLANPRARRVVATSFDSAYLQQGLNLIAALHRTSIDSFDEILVFPLELSEVERQRLSSIEKVRIVDYPQELTDFFPEYLEPKTRAYKPYAIRKAAESSNEGDLILWMDAGLAPLQDIDAIFNIIEDQEFFITDHDDKKGWPFFNVNFAHRGSHAPLGLDNVDLLAPHLCSALIGYKRGGKYQAVVDEAYRLGQIREAVVWPKVPAPSEKYKPQLTPDQQVLRRQLAEGVIAPHSVGYETLISIFDYHGHRTQVIYSVLAHRAGAPVFSALIYRRSNDESSRAAVVNWTENAHHTDRASSRRNLAGIDPSVAVYHHRGIYNNLDGMRHKRDGDALFVVGNGPSLRDFPFESLQEKVWLGMNAAYRYWSQVGLYPTYYSCFDEVVLDSHRHEIVDMIARREEIGISKFFLRESILETHPELRNDPSVYFLEDLERDSRFFADEKVTTGSFSALVGSFLGYREIYLLGVDLNYVERLPESVEDGQALKLAADPDFNPNYFFDGYQRKGDRFNPPNRRPGLHLRSWSRVHSILSGFPIRIKNLNPNSAVREFEFEDHRVTLRRLEATDRRPELTAERVVQIGREKRYWRESLLEELAELASEADATNVQVSNVHQPGHNELDTSSDAVPAVVSRRRTILRRLIRWYASPSGLLFGAALALATGALLVPSWSRWLALAALALAGVFMPYRLSREQARSDSRLRKVETKLGKQSQELAENLRQVGMVLTKLQGTSDSINKKTADLGSQVRSLESDLDGFRGDVRTLQSDADSLRDTVEALRYTVTRTQSDLKTSTERSHERQVEVQEELSRIQEGLTAERKERVESFGHAVQQLASSWSPVWLANESEGTPPRGNVGPEVLKGKRLIFCASSGRVGTHYLAGLLGSCERVHSVHEAPPYMIGPHLNRVLREPLSNSYEQRRIKAAALRATLAGLPRGSVYAETNHMFVKTFHDVVINEFPPESISVVVLRRSLDRVLKSLLELGYFTGADTHWPLWMYIPDGPTLLAKPPRPIDELDDTDRAIGYLFDIEARLQQFRIDYPGIRTVDAWLEEIHGTEGAATLLKELGLVPTATTQAAVGKPTNERTTSRVTEIDIEECQLRIRDYHYQCREAGVWAPDLHLLLREQ